MKLAIVADVHVGNFKRFGGGVTSSVNARCNAVLAVLKSALAEATKHSCDTVLIAGDLLDYARPEAPVMSRVQGLFESAKNRGLGIIVMVGNHEQISTAPGDHALGPLSPYARVVEQTEVVYRGARNDVLCVPFRPGHAREWLRDEVERTLAKAEAGRGSDKSGGPLLLALHLGIKDAKTAPWLAAAPDSIDVELLAEICFDHGITHVVAGNWHDRREWKISRESGETLHVFQLGALCPTGWNNPGLHGYGTLGMWESARDGARFSSVVIPGPRFVHARTTDELYGLIEENEEDADARCPLFVSRLVEPSDLASATAEMAEFVKGCKVEAFEVLPDQTIAKAEARAAGARAASADNLAEALETYVKSLPVPEGVSRANVLARCERYYREATK